MCEHLTKAKAALEAARDASENERVKLLDIAWTQAAVAQAEALVRLADRFSPETSERARRLEKSTLRDAVANGNTRH
jgi:hypothetical protein